MRRPSSNHQRGVSKLTCTSARLRNASQRRWLDAATALWAIVSTFSWRDGWRDASPLKSGVAAGGGGPQGAADWPHALGELERIQPELGAEGAPELPGTIRCPVEMVVQEPIHGCLRKEVATLSPRIPQQVKRRRGTAVAQPVTHGRGKSLL